MKLYTKTGDDGTTGLPGGGRVPKDAPRVSAYGEVDELNAVLGWCLLAMQPPLCKQAQQIQNTLFAVGAELACAPENKGAILFVPIDDTEVERLERWIDEAVAEAPPLSNFVLPGGCEAGARLHVARTVCRRAERAVATLVQQETVRLPIIQYLNRLSDLLFAWARQVNHVAGQPEISWKGTKPKT